MCPNLERAGRRRGLTLIEILVVMAVGSALMVLLLGILVRTRASVEQQRLRLEMASYAESVAYEVADILAASVRPEALDANPGPPPLVFQAERCAVVSSRHLDEDYNFLLWELSNDEGEIELNTRVLDAGRHQGTASERVRRLGVGGERYRAAVSFEYATQPAPAPGEPVAYRPNLAVGEYPELIRLRLRITDTRAEQPAYDLYLVVNTL